MGLGCIPRCLSKLQLGRPETSWPLCYFFWAKNQWWPPLLNAVEGGLEVAQGDVEHEELLWLPQDWHWYLFSMQSLSKGRIPVPCFSSGI